MKYEICPACGKVYTAVAGGRVIRFDSKHHKIVWRCPNCGHIIHTLVHFHHEQALDIKPDHLRTN